LSNGAIVSILFIAVLVGTVAGAYHDQSIKAVYASFGSQISRDADLNSQNQQLQDQLRQLQGLTKVSLVHGTISNVGGTPLNIFFDAQRGPSLSSAVILSSNSYQYSYEAYLGSSVTYGVRISYSTFLSGTQTCAGVPVVLTPTGTDYSQNFTC
jgi:hypothetical protein